MAGPGVYSVRGPNGAVTPVQVPSPGMSLAAFEEKVASGELVIVDDAPEGKPKAPAKKPKAAPKSAGG